MGVKSSIKAFVNGLSRVGGNGQARVMPNGTQPLSCDQYVCIGLSVHAQIWVVPRKKFRPLLYFSKGFFIA